VINKENVRIYSYERCIGFNYKVCVNVEINKGTLSVKANAYTYKDGNEEGFFSYDSPEAIECSYGSFGEIFRLSLDESEYTKELLCEVVALMKSFRYSLAETFIKKDSIYKQVECVSKNVDISCEILRKRISVNLHADERVYHANICSDGGEVAILVMEGLDESFSLPLRYDIGFEELTKIIRDELSLQVTMGEFERVKFFLRAVEGLANTING
jgi:hypothetical protein